MRKTEDGRRFTNYAVAVSWIKNLVLCNSIADADPQIYDNRRFDLTDSDGNERDIFQWFITDCDLDEVEFLENAFNLLFAYSELLDCWILCVDQFGTSWEGIEIEILDNGILDETIEQKEAGK